MVNPIKVAFDGSFRELVGAHLGGINFPSLCDTSNLLNDPISCWGVELPDNPSLEYLKYALTLASNSVDTKSVIQVIGGAGDFDDSLISSTDNILKMLEVYPNDLWVRSVVEIFQAANSSKAVILTGGTQSGIMALVSALYVISRYLYDQIKNPLVRYKRFFPQSIDVSSILAPPQLVGVVPSELTFYPGNGTPTAYDKYPVALAPCTGFLSIPGISDWGSDEDKLEFTQWFSTYIPVLERILSFYNKGNNNVRRVTVLFNGGVLTLAEAYSALLNNSRIVLVEGSGRLADVLVNLLNNDWDIGRVGFNSSEVVGKACHISVGEYESLLVRFTRLASKKKSIYKSELGSIGMDSLISLLLSDTKPIYLNGKKVKELSAGRLNLK